MSFWFLSHSPIRLSITCLQIIEAYFCTWGSRFKNVTHSMFSAHKDWCFWTIINSLDRVFCMYPSKPTIWLNRHTDFLIFCIFDTEDQCYFLSSVLKIDLNICHPGWTFILLPNLSEMTHSYHKKWKLYLNHNLVD